MARLKKNPSKEGVSGASVKGNCGVEAVIDKDFASEKLAELVDADALIILTAVDHIYIDYNKPSQKKLEHVSTKELKQYAKEGQFAPGSGPFPCETMISRPFSTKSANCSAVCSRALCCASAVASPD